MRRRDLLALAALALPRLSRAQSTPIFDGKSLDGWVQVENSATSLSAAGINDPAIFATWLTDGSDPMSVFLRSKLSAALLSDLVKDPESAVPPLVKEINRILGGPSLYAKERFTGIVLRRETAELIVQKPARGWKLARLNKLLLEDAYPEELAQSVTEGWTVKDGAMASTGAGRGVIYTAADYTRFRLGFTVRHVSGDPDHQACVLIFCTRPGADDVPLDALGGIQLQPPNGGHWDYRPGHNNNGGSLFTALGKEQFDPHEWSRVEIVADALAGTATMSVAQPPEAAPVEVLAFKDPAAGKPGPIAWQMHNAGLFDEYRDVTIRPL
jgi:hypothetical protein